MEHLLNEIIKAESRDAKERYSKAKEEYVMKIFDFAANKGRTVKMMVNEGKEIIGEILCQCPDGVVILDVLTQQGKCVTEIYGRDIRMVILSTE